MLLVYAIPPSLYCAKLRITLRRKGLEWREEAPPGGYGSAAYKAIVPAGNLPALRDGDLLLSDSEAIAEYLNEAYPDPPMLTDAAAERAKARELGRFHDTRLEPAFRALFPYLPPRPAPAEAIAPLAATLLDRLSQLEALLAPQGEAGASLTLGDCGYPITFAWIEAVTQRLGLHARLPDGVSAYRARVEAHPAVSAELAAYRPALEAFLNR